MKTLGAGSVAIGAALTLFALTASPAFANGQSHGGGGGGGHASFGGHASAGGRSFGGGGAHFARAPSFRAGGYGGGSYRGYGGGVARSASVGRAVATTGYARAGAGFAGRPGAGFAGRPGGRFVGGVGGRYGGRWGGGYWRGGFWPGVFWGGSFAWFLPVLPAFCATYWWNSVPYYYYNDVYYTYDPSASGYVVTTPPPRWTPMRRPTVVMVRALPPHPGDPAWLSESWYACGRSDEWRRPVRLSEERPERRAAECRSLRVRPVGQLADRRRRCSSRRQHGLQARTHRVPAGSRL